MPIEKKDANANGTSGRSRAGGQRREREILEAAVRIFHERGYANTSVQDIADAVGILKGSLYYYIDSKEDLLFRVLSDVHEDARGIVDQIQALDGPPLEKLREYVRSHIEYSASNLTQIAVYYHDFGLLSPKRRSKIVRQRHLYEGFLVGLIQDAQARGEMDKKLTPSLVVNGIFGAINWIYTWYKPGGSVDPQQLGELYGEIVLKGVAGATLGGPKPGEAKGSRAKATAARAAGAKAAGGKAGGVKAGGANAGSANSRGAKAAGVKASSASSRGAKAAGVKASSASSRGAKAAGAKASSASSRGAKAAGGKAGGANARGAKAAGAKASAAKPVVARTAASKATSARSRTVGAAAKGSTAKRASGKRSA
jgi:TetR/AcrR family transcriptional regulator, cholesterol catabolism regulator